MTIRKEITERRSKKKGTAATMHGIDYTAFKKMVEDDEDTSYTIPNCNTSSPSRTITSSRSTSSIGTIPLS